MFHFCDKYRLYREIIVCETVGVRELTSKSSVGSIIGDKMKV